MRLHYSFSEKTECEQIHEYSLDILENTGIVVHSETARALFKNHGATLLGKTVHLPKALVEAALSLVPTSFAFRTPKHRVPLGTGSLCKLPPYGATYAKEGNVPHLARSDDFIRFTKLNQLNPYIDMACPYVLEPFDIPLEHRDAYKMAMSLKYSDKPTFSITQSGQTARQSIKLAKQYFDDTESYLLMGNVNVSAPLMMSEGTADVILAHGDENQPVMIACGSGLSGLTAPPLPASNLLLSNAAVLAGIALAQLAQGGLPVIYGFPLFGVDPYSADAAVGEPTTGLFTMAAADMGRFYKIPTRAGGTFTDSAQLDYQSGFESTLNLFSSLFSGVDCLMHTFGMEDSLNTINYNKYILDEALYQSLLVYLKGFDVNDVTMMMDEITKTGCSENYISMRNLRLIRRQYHPYPYKRVDEDYDILKETGAIIQERLEHYKAPDITNAQQKLIAGCLPKEFID